MGIPAKPPRTRRSYVLEIVIWSALWIANLWQIAFRFRTMTFLMATTAVMAFLLIPILIGQAFTSLRRDPA